MSRTLRRYLTIMSLIPVGHSSGSARVDTERLLAVLAGADLAVSKRTLQRDLEALAAEFPALRCSEKSKPYGWYWHGEAPPFGAPLVGLSSALMHDLVERHLIAALPRALVKGLKPSFEQARSTLAQSPDSRLAAWSRSVRALPAGYPRRPPEVRGPVVEVVYESLLSGPALRSRLSQAHGRQARSAHLRGQPARRRASQRGADAGLHVLGLRGGESPLVHRIQAARPLDTRVKAPRGFNLDQHIRSGKMGFVIGPRLRLRARVRDVIAERLEEVPISDEQRLGEAVDGWCALEAQVHDSMELRGWLRSLGPLIEVSSPKPLREAMIEDVAALTALYAG